MNSLSILLADHSVPVDGVDVVDDLRRFLRPLTVDSQSLPESDTSVEIREEEGDYLCFLDGEDPYYRTDHQGNFLLLLERTLLNLYLKYLPVNTIVFHGSGFYDGNRLHAFLGAPDSGKSTLAARYLNREPGFVSDELIAITPDSDRVYPFPKPLNLDPRRTVKSVNLLEVHDADGARFGYGLPRQDHAIRRESFRPESLCFYNINRVTETGVTLCEYEKGESFLRLQKHVLKPYDPDKAFDRLSRFYDPSIPHFEFRYEDVSELDGSELCRG